MVRSAWRVAIALLLLCGTSLAQEATALRGLARAVHAKDAEDLPLRGRREAVQALEGLDSRKVVKEVLRAYLALEERAREWEERRRPILLAGGGGGKTWPWRWKLDPVRALQDELRQVLFAVRSEQGLDLLLREALAGGALPLSLRAALVQGVESSAADPKDLAKRLRKLAKRNVTDVLLGLRFCSALAARAREAGDWVLEQLEHSDEQVRRQACRTLESLRWGGSIVPLIEVLEGEDSSLHVYAGRALEVLTGRKLGAAARSWRRWLDAEGAPFVNGERELGKGTSELGMGAARGYYFGIPQTGESILYLIDCSLSMRNKLGKKGDAQAQTRWRRCVSELESALGQLEPTQHFNLLTFANKLVLFEDEMQFATPENLRRAKAWIEAMELKLETNTYDGLDRAFLLAGRGTFDRSYEAELDTLFVLTDGKPTSRQKGKKGLPPDAPEVILDSVRRWNPLGRLTVHTIALGSKGPGRFLEKLAAEHGGRYVSIQR